MNSRARMPARSNASEIITFEIGGIGYRAQCSRFDDGRIGEIFLDGPKIGSSAQIAARDAAICASLLFQHGCAAADLRHALQKVHGGGCAGPIGKVLDLIETVGT